MSFMTKVLGAAAALAMTTAPSLADPALIFDLGGKFDQSFNQAAYEGAQRWAEEFGAEYREIELQSEAQREQALRRMAESGANPVVMVGFAFRSILEEVAPEYPDTNFVIVDDVVDEPNVRSIVFTEHEGSYLVGMLAAMASESGTIGFVGGMDIPLIRRFACGYAQGAQAANADIEIIENMTGSTPAAWNDPVRGAELTRSQIDQGADVVYHAAGGTGVGVLQAAADAGILGIGVDSNQNHLHPGSVLTSMLKRVDVAVYQAFVDGTSDGEFETGLQVLDLAAEGVGYALDDNNAALISEEMQASVEEAQAAIIAGDVVVHDYMSDDSCPATEG